MPDYSHTAFEELDLYQASEIRDAKGKRVYGSHQTLRRSIKNGLLEAEFKHGKWFVTPAALESLPAKKAAARKRSTAGAEIYDAVRDHIQKALDATPPLPDDKRAELAALLAPSNGGATRA